MVSKKMNEEKNKKIIILKSNYVKLDHPIVVRDNFHAHLYKKGIRNPIAIQNVDGTAYKTNTNLFFNRIFRTKDIEWYFLANYKEKFEGYLIFNDKDRSTDFSKDKDLQKLREIDPSMDKEYIKINLFIKSKEDYEKYYNDIHWICESLNINLAQQQWLFVHESKNPHQDCMEYLKKWGISNEMSYPLKNPAFNHLSQDYYLDKDWNEKSDLKWIKILLGIIENYLNKKISIHQFVKDYGKNYIEEMPNDALSYKDYEFFGLVKQKYDLTTKNPTEQQREDGYLNYDEYYDWVKKEYEKYIKKNK